jgi:hypothetical protein
MTSSPAIQKIRARIGQLGASLRGAYNFAQQNRNDQRARDRWVVEVVRLERLIRSAEQSLGLLFAEQRDSRAQKLPAAAIAPLVSTPAPVAEVAPAI